jgi:excisionase family DNA binding protein
VTAVTGVIPRLLKTKQAADYLATSKWKIRSLAKDGVLPFIEERDGSPWRFDRKDLDRYIESRKETAGV